MIVMHTNSNKHTLTLGYNNYTHTHTLNFQISRLRQWRMDSGHPNIVDNGFTQIMDNQTQWINTLIHMALIA